MGQIIAEGGVWPCENISLSVAGFEEGISGNLGIGAFLVKGDEAKALNASVRESSMTTQDRPPDKRRRIDSPAGIHKFLVKTENTVDEHDDDFGSQSSPAPEITRVEYPKLASNSETAEGLSLPQENARSKDIISKVLGIIPNATQQNMADYLCRRCNTPLESEHEFQSHQDWHFAKDLQAEEREVPVRTSSGNGDKRPAPSSSNKKKATGRGKPEKGQTRLAFG